MKPDPVFLNIISELFVNLSAGWFGVAFIVPLTSKRPKFKWWVLPIHIGFGIVSLLFSYTLRKLEHNYEIVKEQQSKPGYFRYQRPNRYCIWGFINCIYSTLCSLL